MSHRSTATAGQIGARYTSVPGYAMMGAPDPGVQMLKLCEGERCGAHFATPFHYVPALDAQERVVTRKMPDYRLCRRCRKKAAVTEQPKTDLERLLHVEQGRGSRHGATEFVERVDPHPKRQPSAGWIARLAEAFAVTPLLTRYAMAEATGIPGDYVLGYAHREGLPIELAERGGGKGHRSLYRWGAARTVASV